MITEWTNKHGIRCVHNGKFTIKAHCELCNNIGIKSEHHLIPKSMGGENGPTCILCQKCHTFIHYVFSNENLAWQYHSVELLKSTKEVKNMLKKKSGSVYKNRAICIFCAAEFNLTVPDVQHYNNALCEVCHMDCDITEDWIWPDELL